MSDFSYGTGKRKVSTARTRIYPSGTGQILINNRPVNEYFPRKALQMIIEQPLKLVRLLDKVDVKVNCSGGGISGQAQAVRHGIARALEKMDPELRPALKRAGLLTRDSRVKERKKYGQPGARAKYQYSKR
ncbi:small subunit ribosomal protein S9 [Paucidesulfovibrio gracilis DSM 16080]|uniref:Small ribosomal subunit protein uS9 n=1 Tax=Paucidesulfovibrio gracilis DSM 16080 TaxID=1121449 RepID=A0A1T4WWS4_9BACT|nr:small subunit ribosomal protein S9 [Paucidesulfovibrio gracilis DSM 16080]